MIRSAIFVGLLAVACRAEVGTLNGVPAPHADAWPEEPVAILIEHNPWLMVIGSDTARVSLFRDGTLIRVDTSQKESARLLVSQLTAPEMKRVMSAIEPASSFWHLAEEFNLTPNMTDMMTTELIVSMSGRWKRVQLYGYTAEEWHAPATTIMFSDQKPDSLPREVDRISKLLVGLKPRREVEWTPRYVEVMLWPFEYSQESPLPWPAAWPRIDSAMAFKRGDSYSIILPGSEKAALEKLVRSRSERQAVEVSGKKWAIAYRPVMPGGRWAHDIAERLKSAR